MKARLRTRLAPRPRQRPAEGAVWIAVAIVLIAASIVSQVFIAGGSTAALIAILASVVVSSLAVRARHRGRRLAALDARVALASDDRAPVVYLRSFEGDETPYVPFLFSRRHRRVFRLSIVLFGAGTCQPQTHEERLARALKAVGPVVAIGDPRDRLPDLGASRVYIDDVDWQSTIIELIKRAELVVIETEASDGLIWEVEQVVGRVPPERLLLSIPVTRTARPRPERYEAFRRRATAIFPKPLPEDIANAQFLAFHDDWTPLTFAPTRRPSTDEVELRSGPLPRKIALERFREEFRFHTRRFVLRLVPYAMIIFLLAAAGVVAIATDSGTQRTDQTVKNGTTDGSGSPEGSDAAWEWFNTRRPMTWSLKQAFDQHQRFLKMLARGNTAQVRQMATHVMARFEREQARWSTQPSELAGRRQLDKLTVRAIDLMVATYRDYIGALRTNLASRRPLNRDQSALALLRSGDAKANRCDRVLKALGERQHAVEEKYDLPYSQ